MTPKQEVSLIKPGELLEDQTKKLLGTSKPYVKKTFRLFYPNPIPSSMT